MRANPPALVWDQHNRGRQRPCRWEEHSNYQKERVIYAFVTAKVKIRYAEKDGPGAYQ